MITKNELEQILMKKDFKSRMLYLSRQELCNMLGEDFGKMKDFNQDNPHHCYDLLEHTLCTVEALTAPKEETGTLKTAALFHDIGKPAVAFKKGDRTVFYGHAVKSAEIARPILKTLGYSEEEIARICFFIAHHDDFISFKPAEDIWDKSNPYIKTINTKNVMESISKTQQAAKESGEYIPDTNDYLLLLKLAVADATSQSHTVIQNNKVVDSRENKVLRLKMIENTIKNN